MSAQADIDPEPFGLDPEYDYAAVERLAMARAEDPLGFSRAEFLRRLGVGAGAALLAAAGPTSALASTGRAAGGGGTISFFSWQGYDIPGIAKPWLKRNDIEFRARYFATNDDIAVAVRQGGGKSPFNLSSYYAGQGIQWHDLKLSAPIDISKVPNARLLYDFLQQGPLARWWKFGTEWWGIPFTFGGNTGLYDSATMPAPKSWNEFLSSGGGTAS